MPSILTDIIIVMAVAVVVTLLFSRLRLPTLVGLFVAGVLIGPHAFGLIKSPETVEELAEIGVVFLLFTLGLEMSFRRMARLARVLFIAGPLQLVLTGAAGMGVGFAFGLSLAEAIVLGMLVALSSTAVVLKTMTERAEVDTPVGKNVLGILIFQDILVVPFMIVLPLLAGNEPDVSMSAPVLTAVAVGVVVLVVVLAKWIVPRVLYEAAKSRSADVFLMVVVAICFAVAGLSAWLGLSLALGAFLAGLIISESEYGHHSLGLVMPFRNLLVSFFFVSIGMLLDPSFLAGHWWMVILGAIGLILVKTITGTLAVEALRYPLRVALGTGLALSQVGEFSFVLAAVAVSNYLLPENLRQGFLAVAVLTMAVTPVVMSMTGRLYRLVERLDLPSWVVCGHGVESAQEVAHSNHLLIIGYGINGRNLSRAAREFGFPYAVIELNPQTVRQEAARDEPMHFGDATNEAVLIQAGAERARAAAVVIGDPVATRGIVGQLRRVNPSLHIIARTRFLSEVQPLYALGASDVVPEEFETSIEIFHRMAHYFDLPEEDVQRLEDAIREDHYLVLRNAHRGEPETLEDGADRSG
ncbi:MAG: cation:proton antiporter [Thermoleophilia bacterium]|nr:cation:proton antiporter [Thermoleophilia bacterium]